eukprot:462506_1
MLALLGIFLLFGIHTTVDGIYALISTSNNSFYPPWCISQFLEMFVYTIGKLTLYLFLVLRLHQVFKGSGAAIAKWKLKLLAILFIIPTILFASIEVYISSETLSVFASWNSNWNDINKFSDCTAQYALNRTKSQIILKMIGILLYLMMDFICPLIVLRLFLSRILMIAIDMNMENNMANIKIVDVKFVQLAIKTANLCILAIAFNWIALVKFGGKLPITILHIDVISNCLSVYLSYEFASIHYEMLFKACHHLCYKICIKCCYCCCAPTSIVSGLKMLSVNSQSEVTTSDFSSGHSKISTEKSVGSKSSNKTDDTNNDIEMQIH